MDERLDLLEQIAAQTGLTIDYWEALTRGVSIHALRKVSGNASALPVYMKSSDSPYTRRISSAPFKESRDEPFSQFPYALRLIPTSGRT